MPVNLETNKKILFILVLLVCGGLWFYSAFAQDINANSDLEKTILIERINQFDHLLNISISAPLTALSLTGATFLAGSVKTSNEDPVYLQLMHDARRNLIKAFVIFLACTIAIFIFDFIELLLHTNSPLIIELIDLVLSYSLLFSGFAYLTVAAKKMYRTQVRF